VTGLGQRRRAFVSVYLPALAAAAMVVQYLLRVGAAGTAYFDDSYMFVRYADNLLSGHGYAWNPGEGQTFGCTSIPYVFLIAVFRRLLPGVPAGRLLLWTAGLLGLAAFFLLVLAVRAAVSHPRLRSLPWLCCVLGILLLGPGVYVTHGSTGMDTMLSLAGNALLVLVLFAFARGGSVLGIGLAAACGYLAFLIRPDNGVYGLLLPLLLLGCGFRVGFRRTAAFAVAFLALLALDTWLKARAFGDPLPLTFYVKHAFLSTGYVGLSRWNPVVYLCRFVTYLSPFLLLAAYTVTRRALAIVAAFALPLALTLGYYFTVVQVSGILSRFSFPSLPFVVVPAAICLDRFLASGGAWPSRLAGAARRSLLILPLACLFWMERAPLSRAYADRFLRPRAELSAVTPPAAEVFPRLEWWDGIEALSAVCARLPEGTLVAASEHGFLAAQNPHLRILDLVGLHDPLIAHRGFHADYLERKAPVLIWLPHWDYVSLRREILGSAFFRREYVYLPTALSYGLAVRRDRTDVLDLVRTELHSVDPG
jgi:hypothetical protein